MQSIEERFKDSLTNPNSSEIAGHLWTFRRYASTVRRVVELGTHDCTSATAFLLGKPEALDCFDISRQPEVDQLERDAEELGVRFKFHLADSRACSIPPCGLLFIDTDHVASTLATELNHHSPYVSRYIMLHDMDCFGDIGADGGPGLWKPLGEFLRDNSDWRMAWWKEGSCGLACLVRT